MGAGKKQIEINKHSGDFKIFGEINWEYERIERRTKKLLGYILEKVKL